MIAVDFHSFRQIHLTKVDVKSTLCRSPAAGHKTHCVPVRIPNWKNRKTSAMWTNFINNHRLKRAP